LGIIVILGGIVLFNTETRRGSLKDKSDSWRKKIEKERKDMGIDVMSWELLRKTTSKRSTGAEFAPDLEKMDGAPINIIGFMNPLYEFRGMKEFLLLPLPIECYFCGVPPLREVILVKMKEGTTADSANEPVMVNGNIRLNKGPGQKFYYAIDGAGMGPGEKGKALTKREVSSEHKSHALAAKNAEEQAKEELLPPSPLPGEGQSAAPAPVAETPAPAPVAETPPAAAPVATDLKPLYESKCNGCHGLKRVEKYKGSDSWQVVVDRMVTAHKAEISPQDAATVTEYLNKTFPK
jgi:hypothetical protein